MVPTPVIGPDNAAYIRFNVNSVCDYFLRVGGDGSLGCGTDAGSGVALAGTPVNLNVDATLFPDDNVTPLYVIVRRGSNSALAFMFREYWDDETSPSTAVTTTLSGVMEPPTIIEGVSEDDYAGLYSVEITIHDANNLFFAPTENVFVPEPVYILADGLSTWSYYTADIPWQKEMEYSVSIRVTDVVGNVEERDIGTFTAQLSGVTPPFLKKKKKGGGGCFLATACYDDCRLKDYRLVNNSTGTYHISLESFRKLETLRVFRDGVLSKYGWGRAFISTYYYYSPPMATTIRNRPRLKQLVRYFVVIPAHLLAREIMGYSYLLRVTALMLLLGLLIYARKRLYKEFP
jgi:hypothetical protein